MPLKIWVQVSSVDKPFTFVRKQVSTKGIGLSMWRCFPPIMRPASSVLDWGSQFWGGPACCLKCLCILSFIQCLSELRQFSNSGIKISNLISQPQAACTGCIYMPFGHEVNRSTCYILHSKLISLLCCCPPTSKVKLYFLFCKSSVGLTSFYLYFYIRKDILDIACFPDFIHFSSLITNVQPIPPQFQVPLSKQPFAHSLSASLTLSGASLSLRIGERIPLPLSLRKLPSGQLNYLGWKLEKWFWPKCAVVTILSTGWPF